MPKPHQPYQSPTPPTGQQRFEGALLGVAIGDALGAPIEYMSREQILIKHGEVRDLSGGGWLGLRPGMGTDETGLMLALGRSLQRQGGFDREAAAQAYLAWYRQGPIDVSNPLKAVLEELSAGYSIDEAVARAEEASPPEVVDHGPLTRQAPLALNYAGRPEELIAASMADASITHRDPRAGWGAASFTVLLSELLEGGSDRSAAFDRAVAVLDQGVGGVVNLLPDMRESDVDPRAEPGSLKNSADLIDTLESALYSFFRYDTPEEALIRLLNLGGDTDGAGAVCGALLGAWYGSSGFPPRWMGRLRARGEAVALARALHGKRE